MTTSPAAEKPRVQFGEVHAPWWDGEQVFIVGGGPSLRGRDLSKLREWGYVLGVNRAADHVPCDVTFSLDYQFLRHYVDTMEGWVRDGQQVYGAVMPDFPYYPLARGVTYLERRAGKDAQGLSSDRGAINNGLNSGFGAVNLAVLKGAARIVLLGFDLMPYRNGPTHWHEGYDWGGVSDKHFARWAKRFNEIPETLPEGVEIVNANPQSGVRCFPFTSYEDFGLLKS